jgi:hypothetical protein
MIAAIAAHYALKLDVDDAWIHMRVAHNWASGFGPNWNPGERVEVSTSPMWMALLALGVRLGIPAPSGALALMILGAAGAGAGVARLSDGWHARVIAPVLLATLPSFCSWSGMPMEVAFAGGTLAWSAVAALQTRSLGGAALTGILACISALVRPELMMAIPILVGIAWSQAPRPNRLRVAIVAALTAGVPLGIFFLLRYSYYGAFVPNTYVAKVVGVSLGARLRTGVPYVLRAVWTQPVLFIAAIVGIACGGPRLRLLGLLSAVVLAGVAWTGGDHFAFSRLAIPVIPLVCVLAASVFDLPLGRLRIVLGLLLLAEIPWTYRRDMWHMEVSGEFVRNCHTIADAMRHLPKGTLALSTIGAIGYDEFERPILDLVGLADPVIARSPRLPGAQHGHEHSDVDYVLSRAPEFVIPFTWGKAVPVSDEVERQYLQTYRDWWGAGAELVFCDRFRQRYRPEDLILGNGQHLRIWLRNDVVMPGT